MRDLDRRLLTLTVLLVATAAYLAAASRPETLPPRQALHALPAVIDGLTGDELAPMNADILRELGADDLVNRVYRSEAGTEIGLYIGYYASQRQGDAIHSPMNCMPGSGWQPLETDRHTFTAGGAPLTVNRVRIGRGDRQQLVLYWYQGRGRVVASEYTSKLFTVWDSATRHRTDGALVRVLTPMGPSDTPATATARAVDFARALVPTLAVFLPS